MASKKVKKDEKKPDRKKALAKMQRDLQTERKTAAGVVTNAQLIFAAETLVGSIQTAIKRNPWPNFNMAWANRHMNDMERIIHLAEMDLLTEDSKEFAYNWIFTTLVLLGATESLTLIDDPA